MIIEYCEPIYTEDLDRTQRKQLANNVRDILSEKVKANKKEI